jgi:hypothetical protein
MKTSLFQNAKQNATHVSGGSGKVSRNCDNCGKLYDADKRNLNRGWGLCCSKSCAASNREKSRPDYDPATVARNNSIREGRMTDEDFASLPLQRQMYLNQKLHGASAPSVHSGSGRVTGRTSEGYRIMDGVAYNEWDEPMYDVDDYDDDYGWDSHK